MLLDNHYGPDPRVALEVELLRQRGIDSRVIAWDRRLESSRDRDDSFAASASLTDVHRISVPAPSGGGRRTLAAAMRFGRRVWQERASLFDGVSLLIVHDVYLLPLGRWLSTALGQPFLYDAHEEYALMEAGRYPDSFLRLVTRVETHLARAAAAVVVPGRSRTSRWSSLCRPPIVLPNFVRLAQADEGRKEILWDVVCVGTLSEGRRPDLLIDLARARPDLRIGIAGRGRSEQVMARAAEKLPNLTYLGWVADSDALFSQASSIYYGLDPLHPYSRVACPNTLYEALAHRRPLIFFCGGEPEALAAEFRIGIRCQPTVEALAIAVEQASECHDWDFDVAWKTAWQRSDIGAFVDAVRSASGPPHGCSQR